MTKRTPVAGGFFLTSAILGGTIWGIATANPMNGLLIGTAIGIGLALLIWLIDRART